MWDSHITPHCAGKTGPGRDLLGEESVCIVEWADRIAGSLPEKRIDIVLEHIDPERRRIRVKPKNKK